MSKKIGLIATLALALAGCDDANDKQSQATVGEFAKYAGRDICGLRQELVAHPKLKAQFIKHFGIDRWNEWDGYAEDCGPIERRDDLDMGSMLLLRKVQLAGSMGANTGRGASLLIRLDGEVAAVCFANNGDSEGPVQTEWVGVGWKKSINVDQCSYDVKGKEVFNHFIAAKNSVAVQTGSRGTVAASTQGPPECASPKVVSFIEQGLKGKPPTQISFAMTTNETFRGRYLSHDREFGKQEELCQAKVRTGIDNWFASIGHPERRVGDYNLREMSLCSVPPELADTEAQCARTSALLASEYKACKDSAMRPLNSLSSEREAALANANYTLRDIRTTARDESTGTVMCVANLVATLPSPWDELAQNINYKVEETSDHKLYTTVWE